MDMLQFVLNVCGRILRVFAELLVQFLRSQVVGYILMGLCIPFIMIYKIGLLLSNLDASMYRMYELVVVDMTVLFAQIMPYFTNLGLSRNYRIGLMISVSKTIIITSLTLFVLESQSLYIWADRLLFLSPRWVVLLIIQTITDGLVLYVHGVEYQSAVATGTMGSSGKWNYIYLALCMVCTVLCLSPLSAEVQIDYDGDCINRLTSVAVVSGVSNLTNQFNANASSFDNITYGINGNICTDISSHDRWKDNNSSVSVINTATATAVTTMDRVTEVYGYSDEKRNYLDHISNEYLFMCPQHEYKYQCEYQCPVSSPLPAKGQPMCASVAEEAVILAASAKASRLRIDIGTPLYSFSLFNMSHREHTWPSVPGVSSILTATKLLVTESELTPDTELSWWRSALLPLLVRLRQSQPISASIVLLYTPGIYRFIFSPRTYYLLQAVAGSWVGGLLSFVDAVSESNLYLLDGMAVGANNGSSSDRAVWLRKFVYNSFCEFVMGYKSHIKALVLLLTSVIYMLMSVVSLITSTKPLTLSLWYCVLHGCVRICSSVLEILIQRLFVLWVATRCPTIDQATLISLNTRAPDGSLAGDVCAICLCEHSTSSCKLPCGHILHSSCLLQMLQHSASAGGGGGDAAAAGDGDNGHNNGTGGGVQEAGNRNTNGNGGAGAGAGAGVARNAGTGNTSTATPILRRHCPICRSQIVSSTTLLDLLYQVTVVPFLLYSQGNRNTTNHTTSTGADGTTSRATTRTRTTTVTSTYVRTSDIDVIDLTGLDSSDDDISNINCSSVGDTTSTSTITVTTNAAASSSIIPAVPPSFASSQTEVQAVVPHNGQSVQQLLWQQKEQEQEQVQQKQQKQQHQHELPTSSADVSASTMSLPSNTKMFKNKPRTNIRDSGLTITAGTISPAVAVTAIGYNGRRGSNDIVVNTTLPSIISNDNTDPGSTIPAVISADWSQRLVVVRNRIACSRNNNDNNNNTISNKRTGEVDRVESGDNISLDSSNNNTAIAATRCSGYILKSDSRRHIFTVPSADYSSDHDCRQDHGHNYGGSGDIVSFLCLGGITMLRTAAAAATVAASHSSHAKYRRQKNTAATNTKATTTSTTAGVKRSVQCITTPAPSPARKMTGAMVASASVSVSESSSSFSVSESDPKRRKHDATTSTDTDTDTDTDTGMNMHMHATDEPQQFDSTCSSSSSNNIRLKEMINSAAIETMTEPPMLTAAAIIPPKASVATSSSPSLLTVATAPRSPSVVNTVSAPLLVPSSTYAATTAAPSSFNRCTLTASDVVAAPSLRKKPISFHHHHSKSHSSGSADTDTDSDTDTDISSIDEHILHAHLGGPLKPPACLGNASENENKEGDEDDKLQ